MAATPALLTSERLCRRRAFHCDDRAGSASRMRGASNFAAACVPLRSPAPTKSVPPRPACAAASRSCDPDPVRSSARARLNEQTEGTCSFTPYAPRHGSRIWQQYKQKSKHKGCPHRHPGQRASAPASSSRFGKSDRETGRCWPPRYTGRRNYRRVECTCNHPFAGAAKTGLSGILS